MIEVGRLWRCLDLLEVTSMSSVLLSLSLSMFAVAQALTSLIHDCIEWSSSDILSGGADICNCKSSANEWCMIECESIMADKGLIYMVRSIGPRTEPWGTPECTGAKSEQCLLLFLQCFYILHYIFTLKRVMCRIKQYSSFKLVFQIAPNGLQIINNPFRFYKQLYHTFLKAIFFSIRW